VNRLSIADADDVRIAEYRSIREPALARERGLFVAEGRLVVQRAVEKGCRVRSVLANEAAAAALAPTLERIEAPVYIASQSTIEQIAGYNMHRGCIAMIERPAPLALSAVAAQSRVIVALEDIADADNVGGIFRNAAAFDAGVVLSPRCSDPLYRKAVRTSMGAVLSVAWATMNDWPDGLAALAKDGFSIAALTPREPSISIDDFAAREQHAKPARLVLVAGTEGAGVSPAVERVADYRVRIPISGRVDSLNVAVAVGIALFRLG
jgi:tRNA G18 (ribose-2'-O)-methylase SpoU